MATARRARALSRGSGGADQSEISALVSPRMPARLRVAGGVDGFRFGVDAQHHRRGLGAGLHHDLMSAVLELRDRRLADIGVHAQVPELRRRLAEGAEMMIRLPTRGSDRLLWRQAEIDGVLQ